MNLPEKKRLCQFLNIQLSTSVQNIRKKLIPHSWKTDGRTDRQTDGQKKDDFIGPSVGRRCKKSIEGNHYNIASKKYEIVP